MEYIQNQRDLLLSPLILTANLIFLFGGEVVLDIECLADLLGGFSLNHVGNGLAAHVKKSFDIEVVGSLVAISECPKSLRGLFGILE